MIQAPLAPDAIQVKATVVICKASAIALVVFSLLRLMASERATNIMGCVYDANVALALNRSIGIAWILMLLAALYRFDMEHSIRLHLECERSLKETRRGHHTD